MLSILGNRKTIVSILTMAFLIVGVQGMGYAQPDLELSDLSFSSSSVNAGENFTISVTVKNVGDAAAAATTVIFFRDSDPGGTISDGDEIVGFDIISNLALNDNAAGGNDETTASIQQLPAPSAANTYTYGAYVIPVVGETVVTNNYDTGSLSVVIPPQPDLQVTRLFSFTGSYDPLTGLFTTGVPGAGSFTLQATVENKGDADFTDRTLNLEYHFSATRLAPASVQRWTPITTPVSITPPITTTNPRQVSINLPAPFGVTTFGIYYCYVRVTPADGVSTAANNPQDVNIVIRTASADLVFDSVTVDKSTVAPSESFTLTVPVRNQGTGPSSARTTLVYYRSEDSSLDRTTDTSVGTVTIGTLSGTTFQSATGTTRTETITLTAPDTPGTYYYGAYVSDPVNEPNINTTNNYSAAVAVTVSAPPDLVAEIFEFRPDTVAPGARLTLEATVTNDGEGQSPRTTLRFYESTDRRFRDEDEIDRVTVAALESNRSTTESIRLIAPDTPGTYYYRVQVDEVANEELTTNNTSGYIVLFVETPLVLESVQPSTPTVAPGERFTLTATVRNDGSTTSARTGVTFYSSDDNSITSRDTSIGTSFVSTIAARGTDQVSRTFTAPTRAGTYYYGACIGDTTGSDVCMVTEITVVDVSIADFERPPIYWADADEGTLHSLTDSEIEPFASGIRSANSIAVDMAGGKVYWTQQTGENSGRVRRADLNGSNVEMVRALNNLPQGIAVDGSNEKLYVTNSRGKIQRMNLDGRNYESDFIINLDSPGGIAVDVAAGKIYWTEQTGENTGRLQRADLDGSNVESVRALNNLPYGIAVDGSNEKLYVTNSRGKIQRMDLDGRDFEWNFITDLDSPRGIAVDVAAEKIYWTEAGSIRRANLNGRNHQDVVTGIGTPAAIALSVAPVDPAGVPEEAPAAPGAVAANSDATALHANYPNPFNPETWIPYQLQHAADVEISIHSQSGVLVRKLSLGYQGAGQYMSRSRAAYWDGRNQLGEPVASGLYFYTLTAGDFSATRRMLILK